MTRFPLLQAFIAVIAGISCLMSMAGPAAAQQSVPYGVTVGGEIMLAGEIDEWTVTAQPGDVLLVRAARAGGDLWPRVRMDGSLGNLIVDFKGIKLAEKLVTVPAGGPGSLRVRVSDGFNGTYTGTYSLYVQRLNEPGNATPLAFGATHYGDIEHPGEMHARTFEADPGDVIVARMSNQMGVTSNTVWPLVRIYGPAGNLVAEEHGAVSVDLAATIPAAGPYTVMVGDGFDGTFTGSYGLFVQRVNGPGGFVSLNLAHRAESTIEAPGVMKTYTVTLPEGYDSPLVVRMRQTSGKVWPLLRLYGPDGAMLAEKYSFTDTVLSADVPAGRTYTIIAGDGFNGTFTGTCAIGWSFAITDAARALRVLAGTGDAMPSLWERYNVFTGGDSAQRLDIADAVWIARNAAGLQALP